MPTITERLRNVLSRDEATAIEGLLNSPAATGAIARARAERDANRDALIAARARLEIDAENARKPLEKACAAAEAKCEAARAAVLQAQGAAIVAGNALREHHWTFGRNRDELDRQIGEADDGRIAAYREKLRELSERIRQTPIDSTREWRETWVGFQDTATASNYPAVTRCMAIVGEAIRAVPELHRVPSADLDAEIARRLTALDSLDPTEMVPLGKRN